MLISHQGMLLESIAEDDGARSGCSYEKQDDDMKVSKVSGKDRTSKTICKYTGHKLSLYRVSEGYECDEQPG
jgi:hypothetical protein